jgi:hypothetical protein
LILTLKLWKIKKLWFWPWNNEFGWKKCRHSSNPGQGPGARMDFRTPRHPKHRINYAEFNVHVDGVA